MTFAVKLKSDVVVVGAGPSGCAAAAYLARDGFDVLLLDRARFPREKVCGDGLAPRAVEVLADLGIDILGATRSRPYAIGIRAYAQNVPELDGELHFFLDPALLPGGYGWILPSSHPDGPANLGVGLTTSALAKKSATLPQLLQRFLSTQSVARRHVEGVDLVTRPMACPLLIGARTGRRTINGVLFVGDAAHLVDPLSGQGITYALESGRAAAAAVSLALLSGNRHHLARYPIGVFLDFVPEMLSARALRSLMSRPWDNSMVVKVLQRDESLARAGIAILGGSIPAYWILRPRLAGKVIAPRRLASIARAGHPAADLLPSLAPPVPVRRNP